MSCIQLRPGLDLTRNGSDARDPVEGSNVVLICRAYALSSPPRWTYYQSVDDTAEEQVNISESETPSELGKSKSQRNVSSQWFHLISTSLYCRYGNQYDKIDRSGRVRIVLREHFGIV